MISKETWQTISYGISTESTVKFTKSGFSVKATLFFKSHITWFGSFVNLKEQFDNMSYRLSLLRLQLSNLKATVKHQKCMIISTFDLEPLRVEFGPNGSVLDETNSKNNCHVRNLLVWNRNETIFIYHSPTLRKAEFGLTTTRGIRTHVMYMAKRQNRIQTNYRSSGSSNCWMVSFCSQLYSVKS